MMSCCEDPGCSHAVMAAATLEASKLTDQEREIILGVLAKDEMLRRQQQVRIMRLKAELQSLRRKGALRPTSSTEGASSDQPQSPQISSSGRNCGRCRIELGRVINRGAACRACRLHVCKQCREYSHRATDWVCTVCHKHMEIQAASGEWMNEFVRRPSRRRDHKVYVPAADIIKRTIRRSWTISNPTPRWSTLRSSPDHRPYNSLPRTQDISNYPSLVRSPGNRSPVRRTQSEDVYGEILSSSPTERKLPPTPSPKSSPKTVKKQQKLVTNETSPDVIRKNEQVIKEQQVDSAKSSPEMTKKPQRIPPVFMGDINTRRRSPARSKAIDDLASEAAVQNTTEPLPAKPKSPRISSTEKRVSFEGTPEPVKLSSIRAQSLPEGTKKEKKIQTGSRSLPEESSSGLIREETVVAEVHTQSSTKEESGAIELCDIEPLSGTVFRKVTVRRRRQENMRKVAAVDTGWRRNTGTDPDILDILLPDGDDYKLVFLNSDSSSSKEEEIDDADSSSTASSFPIDECDWDYFEPGATAPAKSVLSWASSASPFGSPGAYRRSVLESPIGSPLVYRRIRESSDEDTTRLDSNSPSESYLEHSERKSEDDNSSCGHHEEISTKKETSSCQACGATTQNITTTQYIPIPVPVPIPFPVWTTQDTLVLYGPAHHQLAKYSPRALWPYLPAPVVSTAPPLHTNASTTMKEEDEDGESSDEDSASHKSSSCTSDEQSSEDPSTDKKKKFSKVFVVNGAPSDSDDSDSSVSSESEEEVDGNGGDIVLTSIKHVEEEDLNSGTSEDKENNDSGNFEEVSALSKGQKRRKKRNGGNVEQKNSDIKLISCKDDVEFDIPLLDEDTQTNNEDIHLISSNTDETLVKTPTEETPTSKTNEISSPNNEEHIKEPPPHTPNENLETTNDISTQNEPHGYVSSPGLSDTSVCSADTSTSTDSDEKQTQAGVCQSATTLGPARYTSLVMIKQELATSSNVNVVTNDTTRVIGDISTEVVVRHTNSEDGVGFKDKLYEDKNSQHEPSEGVTIITGSETLSAFEEGLADDDSWVENLSHNDEDDDDFDTNSPTDDSSSSEEVTLTCSAAIDREDELRGYHRSAIDFTLHTIVEESCEESEVEQNTNTNLKVNKKERPASATDLEKYFFFGLGDGIQSLNSNRNNTTEDAFSETSSIYSDGLDSLGTEENQIQTNENSSDPADLASSRLEKYFLSGFMGFTQRRDSDGSVGSDSEGKPSPEQRRKRLVRARGSGRSNSNSLDNLIANPDLADQPLGDNLINSEDSSSSDSDTYDESLTFDKNEGQFDTVKRKKAKKVKNSEEKSLETTQEVGEEQDSNEEDGHKTPQPEILSVTSNLTTNKNQQSRDSGFIGSCDDLIKEQINRDNLSDLSFNKNEIKSELEKIEERKEERVCYNAPPTTSLTRKDSFNNWSSDEETNLMMCKMRQFFKTMIANSQHNSKPSTPNLNRISPKPLPSPKTKNRFKPPQLLYFEDQLTKLMKTVPGIRDDQVREIVEYLSSEDTWSDSYDSSDYTSSDLETSTSKSALQQQISDSCQQIINKFDNKSAAEDEEGDEGDGGIIDETQGINKETAFVYQKLVASIEKMASGDLEQITPHNSPPLIAKVMHHIGSRLVALMHEVSSGESHASNSPKTRHYHRRLQQKLSNASTTTDDDSTDSNFADVVEELNSSKFASQGHNLLPRSRSHDLLLSEAKALHQSSSGVSDIAEEREASDCERFSWRGSFESALLASDSRNRLSLIEVTGNTNVTTAAKRRSAGDLLFTPRNSSREQLDRVRSCGSIGEGAAWSSRRRSSVPDCNSGGSADGEDEDDEITESRSTLPRGLQATGAPTTNSLPRLPTGSNTTTTSAIPMQKAQSMHHFLPQAKSARYRPPGFNRLISVASGIPKRAVSAPGLQPSHQRRGRRSQQHSVQSDDVSVISEASVHSKSSPTLASVRTSKSATPSPAPSTRRGASSTPSAEWHGGDDDVDRLVAIHQQRSSLSSLGLRSDSMASVYSGAGEGRYGTVTVRGQVEFGLQYNYKAGALEILVKQCKDLAPVDAKRNRSDPYVKVYLLPDKSKSGKRKTKVKKHTLNPVFDECLKFHISLNGLETRTLWLTVWHSDMFGRNDFLGEVTMTLENKVFDDPNPKWYNLQERTEPFEDILSFKGDILVCLKFVPPDMTVHKKGKRSRGTLHVLVKEAKALTAVKAHGYSDPFCKSYLLPEKGRSSKQKTSVAKRTVNPIWNHTFIYDDVTLQELAERCLELTVWDHDRLASNEFLGGVRFSLGTGKHYGKAVDWMDASGKELGLWKSMLERPNFWVEGCVALRPTLDARPS